MARGTYRAPEGNVNASLGRSLAFLMKFALARPYSDQSYIRHHVPFGRLALAPHFEIRIGSKSMFFEEGIGFKILESVGTGILPNLKEAQL